MQLKNYAAWIKEEKGRLKVEQAPLPKAGADDLIIHNKAVAVNPVDWKIQDNGVIKIKYPAVLGEDAAGEVIEVGSNLKDKYSVGDRIIANTLGLGKGPAYGAFQLYPVVSSATAARIPDSVSYADAVVLPLSISTAAAGLFQEATLNLNYPETDSSERQKESLTEPQTLLVWGGSSSVGSSVIQLAKAAGYTVITTASPANYDYCKKLGANLVLDYHNPDVVAILIRLLRGVNLAGAYDAIGSETTGRQCGAVLHFTGGGKIATVGFAPRVFNNVIVTRIISSDIVSQEPKVAQWIWGTYVPWALKEGVLKPSPEPLVVGKGLEKVQEGLDAQKKGVSAKKIVIEL